MLSKKNPIRGYKQGQVVEEQLGAKWGAETVIPMQF